LACLELPFVQSARHIVKGSRNRISRLEDEREKVYGHGNRGKLGLRPASLVDIAFITLVPTARFASTQSAYVASPSTEFLGDRWTDSVVWGNRLPPVTPAFFKARGLNSRHHENCALLREDVGQCCLDEKPSCAVADPEGRPRRYLYNANPKGAYDMMKPRQAHRVFRHTTSTMTLTPGLLPAGPIPSARETLLSVQDWRDQERVFRAIEAKHPRNRAHRSGTRIT